MSGMTRINSRIYLQIFRVNTAKTPIWCNRWKRDGRSHYIRIVSPGFPPYMVVNKKNEWRVGREGRRILIHNKATFFNFTSVLI